MPRVEPTRIVAARRRAGLTKAALAKILGVSAALVGQWEDGVRDAAERSEAIAWALRVPIEFLCKDELTVTEVSSVTFRRRADAKRATRDRAACSVDIAYGDLLPLVRETLETLPFPSIPDLRGTAPEVAAKLVRSMWQMSDLPIKSVVSLLEAKGVRVFYTSDPSPSLSAFTKWIEGEPILFLNTSIQDGCRHRFNAAHELGHLVLHRDVDFETEDARIIEREADAFASAFLLTSRFLDGAPPSFRPDAYFALKSTWGASVGAMIRRMRDAGRFTEWQYENATIWLSKHGYRSNPEPNCGQIEGSVLHGRFVERLADRDLDPAMVAFANDVPLDIMHEMMPETKAAMSRWDLGQLSAASALHDLVDRPSERNPLAFFED